MPTPKEPQNSSIIGKHTLVDGSATQDLLSHNNSAAYGQSNGSHK
jgi:hypothetical protein